MSDTLHPDFLATAPERQFTGKLLQLGITLREEAWRLRGGWAWRILPHGALVAMRVREDYEFRKELRLARRGPPLTEVTKARWYGEVATFAKHLGCEHWTVTRTPDQTEAFLVEPVPLGWRTETCARCGGPADKGPYKEAICTACAITAGAEQASGQLSLDPPPEDL